MLLGAPTSLGPGANCPLCPPLWAALTEVNNIERGLDNSWYHGKAEFNNCIYTIIKDIAKQRNSETTKRRNEIAKQRNETAKYLVSGSLLVLQVLRALKVTAERGWRYTTHIHLKQNLFKCKTYSIHCHPDNHWWISWGGGLGGGGYPQFFLTPFWKYLTPLEFRSTP